MNASLGSSTIYLASARGDLGAGSIITTELLIEKAQPPSSNLASADVDELVEIRVGDVVARSACSKPPDACSRKARQSERGRTAKVWNPVLSEAA